MTGKTYPNQRDCEHGGRRGSCEICDYEQAIAPLHKIIAAKQARIDALMLEYCPEDMTEEQLADYEAAIRHSDMKEANNR